MATPNVDLDRALHAIADPTRRRILAALKDEKVKQPADSRAAGRVTPGCSGLCAGDIKQRVKLSQPTISHHMSILTNAGLVTAEKQGQWRWYSRNNGAIRRVLKVLKTSL